MKSQSISALLDCPNQTVPFPTHFLMLCIHAQTQIINFNTIMKKKEQVTASDSAFCCFPFSLRRSGPACFTGWITSTDICWPGAMLAAQAAQWNFALDALLEQCFPMSPPWLLLRWLLWGETLPQRFSNWDITTPQSKKPCLCPLKGCEGGWFFYLPHVTLDTQGVWGACRPYHRTHCISKQLIPVFVTKLEVVGFCFFLTF